MTQRALLTGGTGFTGSALARRLVRDGWEVHLLARETSTLDALGDAASEVQVHRIPDPASGADVAEVVERALDAAQPHAAFHLAVQRASTTLADVAGLVDTNVRLPALLAAGMARWGSGVMVCGASYMYTPGVQAAPSVFSASRGALEPVLDWAGEHCGLRWALLKMSSIYGAGDPRPKITPELLRAVTTGAVTDLVHRGRLLDLIHVDDVVEALLAASTGLTDASLAAGSRFDVCSGQPVALESLVELVEEVAGRDLVVRWDTRDRRPSDAVEPPATPTWVPGWQPRVELRDGLRDALTSSVPDMIGTPR